MGIVSVDLAPREVVRQRGRSIMYWVGLVAAITVGVGFLTFMLHVSTRMNVKDLFVDPAAKASLGSHVGLFSHLGVLLLWSGATAAIGSALLTRRAAAIEPAAGGFLLSLGALIGWLAIDDLYLLHEEAGGVIARVLLPSIDRRVLEGVVFAVYGLAWIAWLVRYRHAIRRGPGIVLLLALGCLGASVGVDVGEIFVSDWVHANPDRNTAVTVIEELFKLGGIMLLAVYAISVATDHLRRVGSQVRSSSTGSWSIPPEEQLRHG